MGKKRSPPGSGGLRLRRHQLEPVGHAWEANGPSFSTSPAAGDPQLPPDFKSECEGQSSWLANLVRVHGLRGDRPSRVDASWNALRLVENCAAYQWSRAVTVMSAQRFLVELADACLGQRFNEQDFLRNGEFRDHALFAVGEDVSLDVLLAHGRCGLRIPHDERKRPFSPSIVFDADYRAFRHADSARDYVFKLERGDPLASGLDDVLDAIDNL